MAKGQRRRPDVGVLTIGGFVAVAIVLVGSQVLHQYVVGASTSPKTDETYVVAAAGDIACSAFPPADRAKKTSDRKLPTKDAGVPADGRPAHSCAAKGTADLLRSLKPTAVLPLGDLQYECGTEQDFANSYAPTWGQYLPISHPVIGNREYGRACGREDASGYFKYFGQAAGQNQKGWYSFDLGPWHLIALNSECSYGRGTQKVNGCATGSEQERWLKSDLAAHPNLCTLAYWHEPRFSSGQHGDAVQMADIWNDLVAAHVDVVLAGHNHVYERFEPIGVTPPPPAGRRAAGAAVFQDPILDPQGIQQFVVGTGGKNHNPFKRPPLRGESVRNDTTFGVLALTLTSSRYEWKFVPVKGGTFQDQGKAACH